jgi:hypothetical protein
LDSQRLTQVPNTSEAPIAKFVFACDDHVAKVDPEKFDEVTQLVEGSCGGYGSTADQPVLGFTVVVDCCVAQELDCLLMIVGAERSGDKSHDIGRKRNH